MKFKCPFWWIEMKNLYVWLLELGSVIMKEFGITNVWIPKEW